MSTAEPALAEATIASVESRSEAAVRLAMLLSIAVAIEPALMRAMRRRLAPDLDAGAESAFWFSELVGSRTAGAVTLDRDVVDVLRGRLRTSGLLDDARSVIAELHTKSAPTLQVEEELVWRLLRDEPGDADKAERLLQRAVKTMVAVPSRSADIARWADRALVGLPAASLPEESSARLLAAGAFMRIGARARIAQVPDRMSLPVSPGWLAPERSTTTTPLGVQLLERGARFVEAGTSGSGTIEVPDHAVRLVQFEWEDESGLASTVQSCIAEARAGVTVPLPAAVTSLRVRTTAGVVYALSEMTATASGDVVDAAAPSVPDVMRYQVAKVLLVGDDGFTKRVLLESLAETTIGEQRAEPVVWRVPVSGDERVRDLSFWDMPTVPPWLGVLSTEHVAAVIVIEMVGTGTRAAEWLERVEPWLDVESSPPVFVVAAPGRIKTSMTASEVLTPVNEYHVRGRPVVGISLESTSRSAVAGLRASVVERIDWSRQHGFVSHESFDEIERTMFDALDSAGTVRIDAIRSVVQRVLPGRTDDAQIARDAMVTAGVRGALRAMQWPAEQPHYLVFGRRFQATIDEFVRELSDPSAVMPVVLHGADDGPTGALRSLVMDECERRGVGFQVRVGSARWLVVPEAAQDGEQQLPSPDDFQRFDCFGVSDSVRLWWTLLLELQGKDCMVFRAASSFAEVSHYDERVSMSGSSFRITLEEANTFTLRLWTMYDVSSQSRRAFGERVEATLRRVAGAHVEVLVEDLERLDDLRRRMSESPSPTPSSSAEPPPPPRSGPTRGASRGQSQTQRPLRLRLCGATADRGQRFSIFAMELKLTIGDVTGRDVVFAETPDDEAPEPAHLFIAVLSPAFSGDSECMRELEGALRSQQNGQMIVETVLWDGAWPDSELLSRLQPYEPGSFQPRENDTRTIRDLSTKELAGELHEAISPLAAIIAIRLDGQLPLRSPVSSEAAAAEWRAEPNTARRPSTSAERPILMSRLMVEFATIMSTGALHPSHPLERTELYLASTPEEQQMLQYVSGEAPGVYGMLPAVVRRIVENDEEQRLFLAERPGGVPPAIASSTDFPTYVERVGATIYRYALWVATRYEGAAVDLPAWVMDSELRTLVPRTQLTRSAAGGLALHISALPSVIEQLNAEIVSALRGSASPPMA